MLDSVCAGFLGLSSTISGRVSVEVSGAFFRLLPCAPLVYLDMFQCDFKGALRAAVRNGFRRVPSSTGGA